ncbi:MAG: hypothetical protein FJ290_19725 [Planctomycetes bacterium]|nr:hypothetical protein [Planctomycetota bacterium]
MSVRVAVLPWFVVLCAALSLHAQAGEIAYCERFDAAVEAAGKGRQLVMVVVVADKPEKEEKDLCKVFREESLPDEAVAKVIRRHFVPYLLDATAVNQGKQAMPPALRPCFKAGAEIAVPMAIFLDPQGKEVHRIVGYAPAQTYAGLLKRPAELALALYPEKDRRDAQRAFERGKQALEEKDYVAAAEALKEVLAAGIPADDTEAAQRLIEEIGAKAAEALQTASDLEGQEKLGSAIRAYRECARGFKGTEAGAKAAARLIELRKDPAIRKRLSDYMGAQLLAGAKEDLRLEKVGLAVGTLDAILKRYPDAAAAAEARKLRERIDADPVMARRLRDDTAREEAERLLRLGDSFRRNKMQAKAIAEYERVLAKFPDTTFAETAKARIAEARKEGGE